MACLMIKLLIVLVLFVGTLVVNCIEWTVRLLPMLTAARSGIKMVNVTVRAALPLSDQTVTKPGIKMAISIEKNSKPMVG
jgi:hypothetical protein